MIPLIFLYAITLVGIAPQTTLTLQNFRSLTHTKLKKTPWTSPKKFKSTVTKTKKTRRVSVFKEDKSDMPPPYLPILSKNVITDPHVVLKMSGLSESAFQSFQDVANKSHLALIFRSINPALREVFDYIWSIYEEIKNSPSSYAETSLYKFVFHHPSPSLLQNTNLRQFEPKPKDIKAKSGFFPFIGPFLPKDLFLSKLLFSSQKAFDLHQQEHAQLIKKTPYSLEPLILTLNYLEWVKAQDLFPLTIQNQLGVCSLSILEIPPKDIRTGPLEKYFEVKCFASLEVDVHASKQDGAYSFSSQQLSYPFMKYLTKKHLLPPEITWIPSTHSLISQTPLPSLINNHIFVPSKNFLDTEISITPLTVILSTQKNLLLTQLQALNEQPQYISIKPQTDPTLRRFAIPHTEELCRYFGTFFKKSITYLTLSLEFKSQYRYDKFLDDFSKKYPDHLAPEKKKLHTIYITKFSPELFEDLHSQSYYRHLQLAQTTDSADVTHLRLNISKLSRHHLLELYKLSPPHLYLKDDNLPPLEHTYSIHGSLRILFPLRFIEVFSPYNFLKAKLEEHVLYAGKTTEDSLKNQYDKLSAAKRELDTFIQEFEKSPRFSEPLKDTWKHINKYFRFLDLSLKANNSFFILFPSLTYTLNTLNSGLESLSVLTPNTPEDAEHIESLRKNVSRAYIDLKNQWPSIEKKWADYYEEASLPTSVKKEKLHHSRQHRPLVCRIFFPDIQDLKNLGEPMSSFLKRFPESIYPHTGLQVSIVHYHGQPVIADADMASIGFSSKSSLIPQSNEFFRQGNFLCPQLETPDLTLGFISSIEKQIFQNINTHLNTEGFPRLIAHGSVSSFPQNLLSLYCDLILILPNSPPCLLKDVDTYLHILKSLAKNAYVMQINAHFLAIQKDQIAFKQKNSNALDPDETVFLQAQIGLFNHIAQTIPPHDQPPKLSPILKKLASEVPPLFDPKTGLTPLSFSSTEDTSSEETEEKDTQAKLIHAVSQPSKPKTKTFIIRHQKKPLSHREVLSLTCITSRPRQPLPTLTALPYPSIKTKLPSSHHPTIPRLRRITSPSYLLNNDIFFVRFYLRNLAPNTLPLHPLHPQEKSPKELFKQNYGTPINLFSLRQLPLPIPDLSSLDKESLTLEQYFIQQKRQKLAKKLSYPHPKQSLPLIKFSQSA